MICPRPHGSYCNSLAENPMPRAVSTPALLLPWAWVDRYALVRGGLVVSSVWAAAEAQDQVNCSEGVPRTGRAWCGRVAGTQAANFYMSNPVSWVPHPWARQAQVLDSRSHTLP